LYFENRFSANLVNGSAGFKKVIADAVSDILQKRFDENDIIADVEQNASAAAREPIDELVEIINSEEGDSI